MSGILGVDSLDAMFGNVPKGSRILITSEPDVDGRAILLQAARHGLRSDRHVIYVTTERPPSSIRRALSRSGQTMLENLHFVDVYSGQLGTPEDRPLAKSTDLAQLVGHLEDLAEQHPHSVLCIESISSLASNAESELLQASGDLLQAMQQFEVTLALYVSWPELPNVERLLKKFDGGLHFYGLEDRIVRNNALKVDFLTWVKSPNQKPHLVTVREDGALRALVPKIAVTGPEDAGKTTFVRSVSDGAVGTERGNTTVALDKGHYESDGAEAEVFGTPGQKRFDPLVNTLLEQAAAVILMVDSTNPDSFERAEELLDRVLRRGLNVVLAANKQDLKGAMTPAELEERFGIPVLACNANDQAASKALLADVLQRTFEEVSA